MLFEVNDFVFGSTAFYGFTKIDICFCGDSKRRTTANRNKLITRLKAKRDMSPFIRLPEYETITPKISFRFIFCA